MGKGAMGAVLDAVAPVVGVVDAHPRLVIPQVVTSLCVPGSSVEQWTPEEVFCEIWYLEGDILREICGSVPA